MEKLKALFSAANSAKAKTAATVLALSVACVGSAHAALPAEVDTMFTSIQTDGESAIAKMWPLMLAITGGFIVVGLVRRALTSGAR
ncbi:major coat protein [Shewanella sp. SM29]|uniref:major coat protein n=1 Tax=Shewanella TaxID=22 RepID=UPI0021DAAD05|nr:major coat protein [Shewanella sp. SM29]MCU8076897.1 hypothetical protein [Shewanella sp. SM29]